MSADGSAQALRDAAEGRRKAAKREVSFRTKAAIASSSMGDRDVADRVGVSRKLVRDWGDEERPAIISLADLHTLAEVEPELVRALLAPTVTKLGLALVPSEAAEDLCDDLRAAGHVLASAGALAQHHATSCSDGHLDVDEAAAGLPKAREARIAATVMERRYEKILADRSGPVLRAVAGGGS